MGWQSYIGKAFKDIRFIIGHGDYVARLKDSLAKFPFLL